MRMSRTRKSALWAAAIAGAIVLSGATTANASTVSGENSAEAVFEAVYYSSDPVAAIAALSPQERALFDAWVTPVPVVTSTTWEEPAPTTIDQSGSQEFSARAASCSNFTQRGTFQNQAGGKLGEFWTTGQGCRSGNSVTSVSYIDGGGLTTGLGWSYVGKTTNKGISGNVGKVYGAYTFKLNIAGVEVQRPTYCARTIHNLASTYGDGGCGL